MHMQRAVFLREEENRRVEDDGHSLVKLDDGMDVLYRYTVERGVGRNRADDYIVAVHFDHSLLGQLLEEKRNIQLVG